MVARFWLNLSTSSKLTVNVFLSGRPRSLIPAVYFCSPSTLNLQNNHINLKQRTSQFISHSTFHSDPTYKLNTAVSDTPPPTPADPFSLIKKPKTWCGVDWRKKSYIMKLQWLENNQLIKNKYIKVPHVLFQQSKNIGNLIYSLF